MNVSELHSTTDSLSLTGCNALVFAATGAISAGVARRLAAAGATVFLSGRQAEGLASLGDQLRASWTVVDATDDDQVSTYVDRISGETDGIDVVFNGIGVRAPDAAYATPATALPLTKFLLPLEVIVASQFLTARAAARHMAPRGHGSIVLLSASLSGKMVPYMAGITAACGAIDALTRSLAAEWGPAGVRVNCVRAGGMPETRTIQETFAQMARTSGATQADVARSTVANALQRSVTVAETAEAVAFLASERARGMSGQVVNVCAGAMV